MHEIIRKINIPTQEDTGIIEERKLFAEMKEQQDRQARKARRDRLLEAVGWRRSARRDPTRR